MSIEINGVVWRSLVEQVFKNKEDIARHYAITRALNIEGISLVGRVDTVEDLPDPDTYAGDYWSTFIVGAAPPYTFYTWARPDPNAGEVRAYWLSLGELAIEGPAGPQGPKGDKGDPGESTEWSVGELPPSPANEGDLFLRR